MKVVASSLLLLALLLSSSASMAMVGKLPKALQNKNDGLIWSLELSAPMAQDIIDQLNNYGPVKLILDPKLSKVKLASFKMDSLTIVQAAEKLCGLIGAKAYAQGSTLYISKTAPSGAAKDDGGKKPGDKAGGGKAGDKAGGGDKKVVQPPPPVAPKKFTPGTDSTYRWDSRDYSACAKAGKSILLYVYDPYLKDRNAFAVEIESQTLRAPKVQAALKNFLMARVPSNSKKWPASFVTRGKKGAAIFIMSSMGRSYGIWDRRSMPTATKIIQAAERAEKSSEKQRALKDKFKPVDKEKKAKAEAEQKKRKGTIPGIDKKKEPEKPDENREMEEEEE